jgi:RHS repeat-associated protein
MILRKTPHGIRYQCWDNEDRLVAVHDEGDMPQISAYLYDGGGERVWKLTGGVIQNYMNGQQIYNSGHLDKTLYASPYMVMTEKEYTKHYYIEGERICSKIGSGFQGAHTPPTSHPIDFIAGSIDICSKQLIEMVDRNVHCASYNGNIDIDPYLKPAHNNGNEYEKLQYFYHSDHLGSASFVTNAEGAVCQHLQYLPFGEIFVSQRNCEFDSRYKFTAKELDNETSYTYFGARYYDSDLSVWLSVDPMSDKYPSLSPYIYSANNPIIYVDPDGHKIKLVNNYAGAMTNIAQIAATSLGNQVMSQLIGRNETYTMRSTFFSSSSSYNPANRKISYVGNPWYNEVPYDGGALTSMVAMGHELLHAFDHSNNAFNSDNAGARKGILEPRAVSFENYLRDAYGLEPSRNKYGSIDGNFHQFSGNGSEKISNFTTLGSNEDGTSMGFSYTKTTTTVLSYKKFGILKVPNETKTETTTYYMTVSMDADKNVTYQIYNNKKDYNNATSGW